jgi:hypothetical protein
MRASWDLPISTTLNKFIAFLITETPMNKISLTFIYQPAIRYCWGEPPPLFELINETHPLAYISHASAVHVHKLISHAPDIAELDSKEANSC